MTMLIAHSSHWLVNVLYLAPVVTFLSWLGVTTYKERRRGKAKSRSDPPDKR